MLKSPTERAYEMAASGRYDNFTQIKRALRREFNVDRELVGRQLSADVTKVCRAARSPTSTGLD